MNKFEQLLSANKTLLIILTIAASPLILSWCLLYGVIVGLIGITVDRFEYVAGVLRGDAISIIKYPKWSAQKHQEAQMRSLDNPDERNKIEWAMKTGRVKSPRLSGEMLADILIFGFLYYPFLLIWGAVTGPVRSLIEFWKWYMKLWGRIIWDVNYY